MNKTLTHNGYLFVDVPKGETYFSVNGSRLIYGLANGIDLPPGSYSLVGRARELSDKDWIPICDSIANRNPFLKSLGVADNCLILKIEK